MSDRCEVLPGGTIFLGDHVSVDGFSYTHKIRVITHIHEDHAQDFRRSLGVQDPILMLPATRDLLLATQGRRALLWRKNLIPVSPEKEYQHLGQKITLVGANHILGSAQVHVETEDGWRLGYSGDFGWPCQVMKVNNLVIDASCGGPENEPSYTRSDCLEVLIDLVKKGLASKTRVAVKAYTGRLQYAMQVLQEQVAVPFLASKKQTLIAEIYRNYGLLKKTDLFPRESNEAKQILNGKQKCILFKHIFETQDSSDEDISISLTRFRVPTQETHIELYDNNFVVALSDHANFSQTIQYIQESGAKLVVVDGERGGDARALASEIRTRVSAEVRVNR